MIIEQGRGNGEVVKVGCGQGCESTLEGGMVSRIATEIRFRMDVLVCNRDKRKGGLYGMKMP